MTRDRDPGAGPAEGRGAVRLDLRLAAAAIGAWVACGVALHGPARLALWAELGGVTLCAAGWAVLAALRPGVRRRLAAAAAIGVAAGAGIVIVCAPLIPRLNQARQGQMASLASAGRAVEVEGSIVEDPRATARPDLSGAPRAAVLIGVRAVRVAGGSWTATGGQVVVLGAAQDWLGRTPTEVVRVRGTLTDAGRTGLLSGLLFVDGPPERIAPPRPWFRWSDAVRADLRDAAAVLPPGPRGLLPGLVLGDVSEMDPVLAQRFRSAGLAHLVAVSGANVAIVAGGLLLILRRARVPARWCAVLGAAAIIAFVVLARPSPSVIRAAVMAGVAMAGLGLGRARAAMPLLSCAVLGVLVWRPAWALDIGFAMSVAATAALVVLAPGWSDWLRRRGMPGGLAEAVAVAAAATAATLPMSAAISGTVSLLAVPANVLAAPAVPMATVLGVLSALCATVWPAGGELLARVAGAPCRWLVEVAEHAGSAETGQLPWRAGWAGALLAAAALVAVGVAIRRGAAAMLAAALLAGLLVDAPLRDAASSWPPPGWRFVVCDVGQGDGMVLRVGAGSAIVVDAGAAPAPMDRCLADLGVRQVPLLVITHFHADHVGGLAGVFHRRTIGRIVAGPLHEPATGFRLALDVLAAHGRSEADLEPASRGEVLTVGGIALEVLSAPRAMHGTRSDPNNSSLVLRATVEGLRILLAGDSEVEEQQEMLRSGAPLDADVLKTPHHGSAHVDARWIARTGAGLAIISVGADNTYGLPAPSLLSMLSDAGMTVLRTDQLSDVALALADAGWVSAWRGVAARAAAAPAGTTGIAPRAPPAASAWHRHLRVTPPCQERMTGCADG